MKRLAVLVLASAAATAASCSSQPEEDPPPTLTGEALLDPQSCLPCHASQVNEWSGSMHAYAAEDPVFLAMNKRMLRETGGAHADFCVSCHAPVAVRLGKTTDGSNLAELPSYYRGVTCYFCHAAEAVEGTHNNPIKLATDDAMRGGISDPARGRPHAARYSALHDRETPESSSLCGACHDVVTPHGAKIERTFDEWKASLYSKPGQLSCGKCHMEGREGLAAFVQGAPTRTVHDHAMPAVDVALTPFPNAEQQRAAVQSLLDQTIIARLCVQPTTLGVSAIVRLDNAFAGHGFPTGANQDRRAWVELVAYRAGAIVYQSGVVADRQAVASIPDPDLWLLRDKIFATDGREVHMFWEAARFEPSQLPAAVTNDPNDPAFDHSVTRTYVLRERPDRVTMRVRMRPIDFDLLDDLVASGDLDPAVLDRVPTFDLASTVKEWSGAFGCVD